MTSGRRLRRMGMAVILMTGAVGPAAADMGGRWWTAVSVHGEPALAAVGRYLPGAAAADAVQPIHVRMREALAVPPEQAPPRIVRRQPPAVPSGAIVRPGDRDPRVPVLRRRLDLPVPATDPEVYDDELADRVRAYQVDRGLNADGVLGPLTVQTLNEHRPMAGPVPDGLTLHPGDDDPRVAAVRARLDLPPGTVYDAATVAAVRAFQADHGLPVDGLIGSQTIDALNRTWQPRPPAGYRPAVARLLDLPEAPEQPVVLDGVTLPLDDLARLYWHTGNGPLWTGPDGGPTAAAGNLIETLISADQDGLPLDQVALDAIRDRWQARTGRAVAQREMLLSAALLRHTRAVAFGRVNPYRLDPSWNMAPRMDDPVTVAAEILAMAPGADRFQALAPPHEGYRRLRAALADLRAEQDRASAAARAAPVLLGPGPERRLGAEAPEIARLRDRLGLAPGNRFDDATMAALKAWQTEHGLYADGILGPRTRAALDAEARVAAGDLTVPPGPILRQGSRGPRVRLLRRRLGLDGDGDHYDAVLTAAVRDFQRQHGLRADGAVGPATLDALNRDRRTDIARVIANMERWRWLPRDLGDRYVLVNADGYEVEAWAEGARQLKMRAIVGKSEFRTPLFNDDIERLVLNPSWRPTRNMVARGVPDERVPPGPGNPLGPVKFDSPNRFQVYLHGTSKPHLFRRDRRNFSSGCVRVEDPRTLAAFVLNDPQTWPRERIERATAGRTTRWVPVDDPVPVYFMYWTAWVNDDGVLRFGTDSYGRDPDLLRALDLAGEDQTTG